MELELIRKEIIYNLKTGQNEEKIIEKKTVEDAEEKIEILTEFFEECQEDPDYLITNKIGRTKTFKMDDLKMEYSLKLSNTKIITNELNILI